MFDQLTGLDLRFEFFGVRLEGGDVVSHAGAGDGNAQLFAEEGE